MKEESKVFQTFFYQGHQIRTIEYHGEMWWVAADVCKVLDIANVSMAVNGNEVTGNIGLDEDEKVIMNHYTLGGPQATLCVNEPGLYHLISKSRTPEAKTFGRWIRHEVLPSLRKTGRYSLPQQESPEPQQQPLYGVGLEAYLLSLSKDELVDKLHYLRTTLTGVEAVYNYKYAQLPLSKDALRCELHYLHALLATVEVVYNYKYPHIHTSEYPQEEPKPPHPIETLVLPPVETRPDLQTVLLNYIHKTEDVTVRQIQQSGPRSLRNLSADQLRTMLQALVTDGVLTTIQVGKAEHYSLP